MSANLSATFYLISGILFILALRGLSSPETSRQGNYFGIAGMAIAIIVTFLSVGNFGSGFIYVLIFLVIGGSIGAFIAFKIPMTAMPELVAGFHSLVGLAAVFVAISAFLNPEAFNLGSIGNIKLASLIFPMLPRLKASGFINAEIATNTAAKPTKLWKPATSSGIAVIGILNAINAPTDPPIIRKIKT